jgi:hypothetical protein
MAAPAEMTFGSLLDDMRKLDLEAIAVESITETIPQILDRNKRQLYHGLTSEGQNLRKYRRRKYAEVKNEMNPLPGLGNPDFFFTGDFYNNFFGAIYGEDVVVNSRNWKATKLEARDGADHIYGLGTEEHQGYVREDLSPVYYLKIHKRLKLSAQ